MNNCVFLADLHLTDKARDEYRWGLFPWLIEMCSKNPERFDYLVILGDLTEAKDYHSARLVNRVVQSLLDVRDHCGFQELVIVAGNHDGIDAGLPFFSFMRFLARVRFAALPEAVSIGGHDVLLLPHTANPSKDWAAFDVREPEWILMHGPMEGVLGENGSRIRGGIPHSLFADTRARILAGDIHTAQKCGKVEYVGAPYQIKFGDTYEPRAVVYIANKRQKDWLIPGPRKHTFTFGDPSDVSQLSRYNAGDHVKVRVALSREQYHEWTKLRQIIVKTCDDCELVLHSIELQKQEQSSVKQLETTTQDPQSIVRSFGTRHKLDGDTIDAGVELLP